MEFYYLGLEARVRSNVYFDLEEAKNIAVQCARTLCMPIRIFGMTPDKRSSLVEIIPPNAPVPMSKPQRVEVVNPVRASTEEIQEDLSNEITEIIPSSEAQKIIDSITDLPDLILETLESIEVFSDDLTSSIVDELVSDIRETISDHYTVEAWNEIEQDLIPLLKEKVQSTIN